MEPNQYALVTGSSSGLGLEICKYLLEEDYVVFGASRSFSSLNSTNYIDYQVDVKDEESVTSLYDSILEETDQLDLIVNSAGIFEMASITETSSELFLDHLMTNTLGPFHILKYAERFLAPTTHVISMSSIASKKGFKDVSAYCASKFGLNGLIECIREEWKSKGVRFSTLNPGAIDTPLWDSITSDSDRETMLGVDDFIHVFDMIVRSSPEMQFPDISFLHKSGVIE